MQPSQRFADIRVSIEAGLSALDNLQSKTTEQSFHDEILDNRQRFMEIGTLINQAGGW